MFDFIKNAFWVLLVAVVLVAIFVAGKRGYFDKVKASNNGVKYKFDQSNWVKIYPWVAGLLLVVFSAVVLSGCSSGESKPAPTVVSCYPSVIEGNVNMPPMADVLLAACIDVKEAGLFTEGMTGERCAELASAPLPNATGFGGGGAYGGRYLTGSYHFEIDANGQRIDDKSWLKLFSDEKYAVTGGVTPDCKIAMGSIGGVQISGSVASGAPVGRVLHGDGKVHIYGAMDGVLTAVK